jgi:hypothetical protein
MIGQFIILRYSTLPIRLVRSYNRAEIVFSDYKNHLYKHAQGMRDKDTAKPLLHNTFATMG